MTFQFTMRAFVALSVVIVLAGCASSQQSSSMPTSAPTGVPSASPSGGDAGAASPTQGQPGSESAADGDPSSQGTGEGGATGQQEAGTGEPAASTGQQTGSSGPQGSSQQSSTEDGRAGGGSSAGDPDSSIAQEAREQGLVRFIGVTGHGTYAPSMHKRSLEAFDFDSILVPYNFSMMENPQYAEDFEALYALCTERQVAMQTIKSIARRPWGTQEKNRTTWYQPLEEQEDIDRAVNWVLGFSGVFLNTAGDLHVLPRILDAASRAGEKPSDEAMEAMLDAQDMDGIFKEAGTIA